MDVAIHFGKNNTISSIDTFFFANGNQITKKKTHCHSFVDDCVNESFYYDEIGRLKRRVYRRSLFDYPQVTKYSWKVNVKKKD
jgi:hypothetical protein